jgi:hypothetical protein
MYKHCVEKLSLYITEHLGLGKDRVDFTLYSSADMWLQAHPLTAELVLALEEIYSNRIIQQMQQAQHNPTKDPV